MSKIYTSLEQSKKLMELGIDTNTADMCYNDGELRIGYTPLAGERDDYFPCWSLAALLNVFGQKQVMLNGSVKDSYWYCKCEDAFNSSFADSNNPVDACYEMILKLHEQKLI